MIGSFWQVATVGALALAGALAGDRTGATADDELPGRRAIAGLKGLQVRSTLAYAGFPERQALVTTFVFPDRARLSMHKQGGRESLRRIHYRLGTDAWSLPPEAKTSVELDGAGRDAILRDLELRRAAFLWPDGFTWRADEEVEHRMQASLGALGEAHAELAPDGSLQRIWTMDAQGEVGATFRIDGWREAFGRRWPDRWSVEVAGAVVAQESVDRIDVAIHLIDAFFQPPDRRGGASSLPADVAHTDLPPALERRVALSQEERRSWPNALAAWRERVDAAASQLAPTPIFELDADGRPLALVLRLAEGVTALPDGFAERPERVGLSRIGLTAANVDASTLRALAHLRPPGTIPGSAYLRLAEAAPDAAAQVVLPYE